MTKDEEIAPVSPWQTMARLYTVLDRLERLRWKGAFAAVAMTMRDVSNINNMALVASSVGAIGHSIEGDEESTIKEFFDNIGDVHGDGPEGVAVMDRLIQDLDSRLLGNAS